MEVNDNGVSQNGWNEYSKLVLAELERQYNIEITYKNININRLFTGGFEHDNLGNALIAITKPMNLTYELSSSNLVILHGENQ